MKFSLFESIVLSSSLDMVALKELNSQLDDKRLNLACPYILLRFTSTGLPHSTVLTFGKDFDFCVAFFPAFFALSHIRLLWIHNIFIRAIFVDFRL